MKLLVNANVVTPISNKPISINPNILELKNQCILIENGLIKKIDKYKNIKSFLRSDYEVIDINNNFLVPGFIDCHTHLVFDGKRIEEFIKRQKGYSYQQIAQEGGGIKYTVKNTINSPNLKELLIYRLNQALKSGTTIIEVKNGYAIDIDKEIDHLKLIDQISNLVKIKVVPTFLSHVPPEDFEEYLRILKIKVSEIREITSFFDIFCDKTAFSLEQTIRIVDIIKYHNFFLRFHTNEFQEDRLIPELYNRYKNSLKVKSFDHLLCISEEEISYIKKLGAFGVIMPSTSWFLGKNYSPVDKLINQEVPICLATDYNAGSSNVISLLIVANLASIYLKLSPESILSYLTINPAFLLKLNAGQIREGFLSIFNILKTDNWKEFCFSIDNNLIQPLIIT